MESFRDGPGPPGSISYIILLRRLSMAIPTGLATHNTDCRTLSPLSPLLTMLTVSCELTSLCARGAQNAAITRISYGLTAVFALVRWRIVRLTPLAVPHVGSSLQLEAFGAECGV